MVTNPCTQTEEGNIHLDHVLNVGFPSLPSSLERALKNALRSLEGACNEISKSIAIVGYAGKQKVCCTDTLVRSDVSHDLNI